MGVLKMIELYQWVNSVWANPYRYKGRGPLRALLALVLVGIISCSAEGAMVPLVAACDGATDDTQAIQAALDNAADGDSIVFPPGQICIVNPAVSAGVRIPSYRTLVLTGATVKILGNLGGPGVQRAFYTALDSTGITVLGGTIIGSRVYVGGLQWSIGFRVDKTSNFLMDGTTFLDWYSDGVAIAGNVPGSVGVTLRNIRISNSGRNAMSIACGSRIRIYDSIFENTNNADTNQPRAGIDIEPNAGDTVSDVLITDSIFRDNQGTGLFVQAKSSSIPGNSYTIVNNEFARNGLIGLAFNQASKAVIAFNSMYGAGVTQSTPGSTKLGLSIGAGARDITVVDNTVGPVWGNAVNFAGVTNPYVCRLTTGIGKVAYIAIPSPLMNGVAGQVTICPTQ